MTQVYVGVYGRYIELSLVSEREREGGIMDTPWRK